MSLLSLLSHDIHFGSHNLLSVSGERDAFLSNMTACPFTLCFFVLTHGGPGVCGGKSSGNKFRGNVIIYIQLSGVDGVGWGFFDLPMQMLGS